MKVLKSYLNGAIVLGWQNGALQLIIDGTIGGGLAAGIVTGQAAVKLAAVDAVENLGEAELNSLIAAHEPSFLPFVTMIEGVANQALAALG